MMTRLSNQLLRNKTMVEIPQKRARRVTLQCLLMILIAGVLGVPISEGATVRLAWDPSPDPQIIGYNVYRSESPGAFSVSPLNGSTLVAGTTFTDSTREWNRNYYYVVTAVNAGGQESAPSNPLQAASSFYASDPAGTIAQPGVITSVSEDGRRWFNVNGASYLWGLYSDVPVPGDFDGDGQTDISVFSPDGGYWWVLTSSSGFSSSFVYHFDASTDTPVPADYDSDGRTDIAVFRASTGVLYILTSSSDFASHITY